MAKLTLPSVSSGYQSDTRINQNHDLIEAAIENTLSRDGTTPNSMGADLDMNSNDVLNVRELNTNSLIVDGTTLTAGATTLTATQTAKLGFDARNLANATDAAALTDGTVVSMAGVKYIVDSTATGNNSATKDLGVDGLRPFVREGAVDARAFGVLGDSASTYNTELGNAFAYVVENNTSPSGLSGWGENKLVLPKGRIRLTSGFTASQSTIGLTIVGAGKYATAIEFESDTAHLFTLTTNISFTLKDMSIMHIDQGAGFGAWTCRMITRTGVGGGGDLVLENVHTDGWAYIDYNSGTNNNDTTLISRCRFIDAQTVMYGRSSQAVINKIEHTTIGGLTTKAFDLAGYGSTVIDTCNIVIDGVTFNLAQSSGLYGMGSVWRFVNTKWEAANNASHVLGSRTQIFVVDSGQLAIGLALFENCVYDGGTGTLDSANYPVISVTKAVSVEFRGGGIRNDATIETRGTTTHTSSNHPRVLFSGLTEVPTAASLIQTDTPQAIHPTVVWENCTGSPNMVALNVRNVGGVSTRSVNRLADGTSGWLENGTTTDHVIDFGGFKQRIVEIYETSGDKIDDHNTKVYSDAGKLTQIGDSLDVTGANGYANDAEYVAPVTNIQNEIVDYLVIEVANGAGSFGNIVVVTDAIPTRGT